ncbi:MAG: hypothetical protein Q9227_006104 [Pyrenula ochraceoflavens]
MSYRDPSGQMTGYGSGGEGRERGARRKKVLGYLKAANDLRQSYQAQWSQRHDDQEGMPGGFPDMEIVRSGREEMVLFPSYARPHTRRDRLVPSPKIPEYSNQLPTSGDAEYWRKEWDKYEDDNAVVDVDVRGWIYSPSTGPLSRRNRLLVAVARRLSGIPAPSPSPSHSRSSSRHSGYNDPLEDRSSRHEDERAAKEAKSIVQRGEEEADVAWRGGYSQDRHRPDPGNGSPMSSRSTSPDRAREPFPGQLPRPVTNTSLMSDSDAQSLQSPSKRNSDALPAGMSREELSTANAHMMTRLKPFMTMPLVNTAITVFFFNDQQSQSRTVHTNDSGHFNVRAALDFVPSSVRVLASENLSATEDVRVTEAKGVSLISDIDDTIKHSAISSGAKEIFRNTFIRDFADLTVEGVKEWYTKLSNMGVKLHYVSNSPWQLFPLLQSYFKMAGLPPGSFHLKQYSGMLQGIFEPAAERKRGSLEKILHDFPDRKFLLVGDSGEADLEVYTELVAANPGRILGIFIRDVTTKDSKRFFEHSSQRDPPSNTNSRRASSNPSLSPADDPTRRPALPPRRSQKPPVEMPQENLIDLSDEPDPIPQTKTVAGSADLAELEHGSDRSPSRLLPNRPAKPLALRSATNDLSKPQQAPQAKKPEPPPPPKPRRSVTSQGTAFVQASQRSAFSSSQQNQVTDPQQVPDEGYVASARHKIRDAYNNLPSARGYVNSGPASGVSQETHAISPSSSNTLQRARPLAPSRNSTLSYPAAAAQYASNRLSWGSEVTDPGGGPVYNKKEEMWRRRWARAEDELRNKGVLLRSWRVGTDVMNETVKTVEKALRQMENNGNKTIKGGR